MKLDAVVELHEFYVYVDLLITLMMTTSPASRNRLLFICLFIFTRGLF
jgi:hypothetical protein